MSTIRFSQLQIAVRSLNPEEAALYVGGRKLLDTYVAAGWVRPYIQRKKLTRYDVRALDMAIDRHQLEDLPGL